MRAIFETPTVAALAQAILNAQQEQSHSSLAIAPRLKGSKAETLLTRLDELSDAEVEELLRDPELNMLSSADALPGDGRPDL
jgi:hypothetical protein